LVHVLQVHKDICYDCEDDVYETHRLMAVMMHDYAAMRQAVEGLLRALADLWWTRTGRRSKFATPVHPDGTPAESPSRFWATEFRRVQAYLTARANPIASAREYSDAAPSPLVDMYLDYVHALVVVLESVRLLPIGASASLGGDRMFAGHRARQWAARAYDYAEMVLVCGDWRRPAVVELSGGSWALLNNHMSQRGLKAMRLLYRALNAKHHDGQRIVLLRAVMRLWRYNHNFFGQYNQNFVISAIRQDKTPPHSVATYSGSGLYNDRKARDAGVAAFAAQSGVSWGELHPFVTKPCSRGQISM
jgi:hypothetical protein